MSNLGLEHYLQGRNLRLERTAVGDECGRAYANGGLTLVEQSGHIVMSDIPPR